MPATIIPKIFSQPDLSVASGELSSLEFQDCMNIIQAFEKAAHYSATEESAIVTLSHPIQSSKYWAKANHEILSSRLLNTALIHKTAESLEISDSSLSESISKLKDSNITDALKLLKDECIPCDTRVRFALEHLPNKSRLEMYSEDIKLRIKILKDLDSLLRDVDIYIEICPLLQTLDFMCPQDLYRMISILMASMFKINLDMAGSFSLIASLIMPMMMPIMSGVINLLDQFHLLVVGPIECVLDLLGVQEKELRSKSNTGKVLSSGLSELSNSLIDGKSHVEAKMSFYEEALKKAMSDVTGDTQVAIKASQDKLKLVRLISLIISVIKLKKDKKRICNGSIPGADELTDFFKNYLNPNSLIQFTLDSAGNISVQEPSDVIFQIEEPDKGAKILTYEPDNLLTKPAQMTFKCSFHTAGTDIAKINSWIEDLNKAG